MSEHCHGRLVRSAQERNVNVLSVATKAKAEEPERTLFFPSPEQNGLPPALTESSPLVRRQTAATFLLRDFFAQFLKLLKKTR